MALMLLAMVATVGSACAAIQSEATTVDSQPVLIHQVPARYTAAMRAAGLSGIVTVRLRVDPQGNPSHIKVIDTKGTGLEESAIEAVRQYKYKPAMANGQPVVATITVEVHFDLAVNPGP